ncbi:uncharacterized protein LOC129969858 isoform X2 [Argiope bruennichi]|nr:uncharacterized protein LOC129969858 isoform X2 [Argiope bruennichi]
MAIHQKKIIIIPIRKLFVDDANGYSFYQILGELPKFQGSSKGKGKFVLTLQKEVSSERQKVKHGNFDYNGSVLKIRPIQKSDVE